MSREKVKVYIYTRVSTSMQIDGYSLDAQKSRMKAFCEFNNYEIAGEYEDAGKLMISVLSAVAEIERENIRIQTMEGRMQKAREGKWNGGFAPYGYKLVGGKLEINEEEAEAIKVIFDQYVNTDIGSNGIAKYLENHGIHKIQRQNGKNPLFDAALIRRIIQNPVYCGKIAYGRRKTEKVHGTRNDYHLVEQDNYLFVDGIHEAIISEEVWEQAQIKVAVQAKKYEKVNSVKGEKIHLLSGLLKCPVCGAGMYGNKSIKSRKDGIRYRDYFYYGCKHRNMTRGHKCDYRKQINEEMEVSLVAAKAKRRSILSDKVSGDNIYKALVFFDRMYDKMNEAEKREFLEQLISKVEIFVERQVNGQWLKSIEFKLPIIEHDMKLCLDNGDSVETVCLLARMGK